MRSEREATVSFFFVSPVQKVSCDWLLIQGISSEIPVSSSIHFIKMKGIVKNRVQIGVQMWVQAKQKKIQTSDL